MKVSKREYFTVHTVQGLRLRLLRNDISVEVTVQYKFQIRGNSLSLKFIARPSQRPYSQVMDASFVHGIIYHHKATSNPKISCLQHRRPLITEALKPILPLPSLRLEIHSPTRFAMSMLLPA